MKRIRTFVLVTLTVAALLPLGGCSCWKDPLGNVEEKKPETLEEMEARRKELQEKQEEKPDFETTRLNVLPADDAATKNQVKPGHWFNAVQEMKANNFDFPKGDLQAQCVDTVGNPIPLPNSGFELRTTRPVSLPEGKTKHFDLLLFANTPRRGGTINFMTQLRPRGGGRVEDWKHEACTRMKPFQNHLVVLADRVDNYQFVKALRSVKPEKSSDEFLAADLDYFVKLPKGTRRVDLPSHPLAWSNIAYVIWDDYGPEILNPSQQQAMVDWLHWGGQLIINGPRTLDRLASSFLAPYLPAKSGDVGALTPDQVAELNSYWSFDEPGTRRLRLEAGVDPPLAIELQLSEEARFIGNTSNLVAAVDVGRGCILATAFNLPHSTFLEWDSYDCFFNSCLLRRPARQFYPQGETIVEGWLGNALERDDPRVNSRMRYFSRDATLADKTHQGRTSSAEQNTARRRPEPTRRLNVDTAIAAEANPIASSENVNDHFATAGIEGFARDDLIGVAGWTDASDVSRAARSALQKSAGISVPSIDFIAKVLGVYLLVLVPVNWLLFRMIGRVEWAWAAVPIISIGGALGVVQAAQLDIGFARSRTEVAVVEIQPGYERAHLTRYIGLYTSLSASYQVSGDEESALFQPLGGSQRAEREVALYQGDQVSLSGFNVLSNSTGMIHGEQMIPLGGKLSLTKAGSKVAVNNQTDHTLTGCCVVQRSADGTPEVAWIGDLEKKTSKDLEFSPLNSRTVEFAEWEAQTATAKEVEEGVLNIRQIMQIATDPNRLAPEEAILIGWNDQVLDGVEIRPAASQIDARTVFVAQLRHAVRPDPLRDLNNFAMLKRQVTQDNKENDNFDF